MTLPNKPCTVTGDSRTDEEHGCPTATDALRPQWITLRQRGICVVIPTYNNAGTIRDVVERTQRQCADVIVVCDGCTDGTQEIVRQMEGITVVAYHINKGKGTALKRGFQKAMEMGFAYAVTLDADGQHFPEDIPRLLKANLLAPDALLVGQRMGMERAERSAGSKFANAFSNFWFCVQTGKRLADTQTGYRLYPLRKLRGMNLLTSRYEAELALLVMSCWHGVRIESVPVGVYYPPRRERVSHFRPGADFARISLLNVCLCVLALVYGYPLMLLRGLTRLCRTLYALTVYLTACFGILLPYTLALDILNVAPEKKSSRLHGTLHGIARFIMNTHGIPGVKYCVTGEREDFASPAVIVCNHRSHLDLMIMLSLTRKLVVLTNDWVWNSPFYGRAIRRAEYYPVSLGIERLMPKLRKLAERGYSIAVYPEGTRSKGDRIARFRQGAFHIADALQLDIVPLTVYGAGHVLPKGARLLRKGRIVLHVGKRMTHAEYAAIGNTKEMASWFRKYCQAVYAKFCRDMPD